MKISFFLGPVLLSHELAFWFLLSGCVCIQMEESEKRKERLRAMRVEAARAGFSDSPEAPAEASCLANPLIETRAPQSQHEPSRASPRFDYYTDPMSAFSGNRARDNAGFPSPQVNFTTPPPPHLSGISA